MKLNFLLKMFETFKNIYLIVLNQRRRVRAMVRFLAKHKKHELDSWYVLWAKHKKHEREMWYILRATCDKHFLS